MLDPTQAWWLPRGSIRALLAMVLVAAVIAGFGGDTVDKLAVMAVGFYFGSKVTSP